eukprot:COSAG06_NODE_15662_length_1054_cov_1.479581_3_plen_44_part_01
MGSKRRALVKKRQYLRCKFYINENPRPSLYQDRLGTNMHGGSET